VCLQSQAKLESRSAMLQSKTCFLFTVWQPLKFSSLLLLLLWFCFSIDGKKMKRLPGHTLWSTNMMLRYCRYICILGPRQTVSIASKQHMLFTVPLHVSSGYLHPCISHCIMSCFDLCFWLVGLQLQTKHVKHEMQRLFFCLPSDIYFTISICFCLRIFRYTGTIVTWSTSSPEGTPPSCCVASTPRRPNC
jgi:hypothetical protein